MSIKEQNRSSILLGSNIASEETRATISNDLQDVASIVIFYTNALVERTNTLQNYEMCFP